MPSEVTERITKRYRAVRNEEREALAEVLCSAYKDATGTYPTDRLREAIIEAIDYNS